ncbi:hypothetical protein CJ195_11150 [Bacillus sp. UMB0899]|nr:hypothetical protein CJ195_11150 [Bacillus sp. UMB0899]
MTLVATYRYGPYAIILNDFRITHDYRPIGGKVSQVDACMKFTMISPRMGMFFAGDVTYIQHLLPTIRELEPRLTIRNVIEENSIFQQRLITLSRRMNRHPLRVIESIGFVFDEESGKNELFLLKGVAGTDRMTISKLPSGKCTVIGSGGKIPGLADKLTTVGRNGSSYRKLPAHRMNYARQYKFDQQSVAEALETKLKNILDRCGSSVYQNLGVSPYFTLSLIGHTAFIMQGRHTVQQTYTTDFVGSTPALPSQVEYSLERDPTSGEIILADYQTGQNIVVNTIENYHESSGSNNLTNHMSGKFDPSLYATSDRTLYIMNQWVDEHFVERKIEKCLLLDDGFFHPDYVFLALDIQEPIPNDQLGRYMRSGTHTLIIPSVLAAEFEESVNDHVFDHEWLQQYIQNYADYYG